MLSDRLDKRGWSEMCVHADQLIRTARGAQLSFPWLCFGPVIVSVRFTKAVSLSGNVVEKKYIQIFTRLYGREKNMEISRQNGIQHVKQITF